MIVITFIFTGRKDLFFRKESNLGVTVLQFFVQLRIEIKYINWN